MFLSRTISNPGYNPAKGSPKGRGKILLSLAPAFFLFFGFNAPAPNPPGQTFQLTGHYFEGDLLVIDYFVPFPGMTKVRLYSSGLELLWRNQYVDEISGPHQRKFRAIKLTPGVSYFFEFDYKGTVIKLPISI